MATLLRDERGRKEEREIRVSRLSTTSVVSNQGRCSCSPPWMGWKDVAEQTKQVDGKDERDGGLDGSLGLLQPPLVFRATSRTVRIHQKEKIEPQAWILEARRCVIASERLINVGCFHRYLIGRFGKSR